MYGENRQGNNILGLNFNLQLNTVSSLTDIMLIYQPTDELKYTDNHQKQVVMRKTHDEPKSITSSF